MTTPPCAPEAGGGVAALLAVLPALLDDVLHDWVLLAEYDGAYALHRCRVCLTEVVR